MQECMEPIIRPMNNDDWTEFEKLDEELFPADRVREESFNAQVDRGAFFALESEGRMVGMLSLARFGEDDGHLGRIGVSKSMQNRGLGAKLMEYAMDWFRNESMSNAILYTQDHNRHAQHLYKKFGFKIVGTTWHYFVPFRTIDSSGKYLCERIQDGEIEAVGEKYGEYLPAAQIRRFLESDDFHVLVLKNYEKDIVGVCRFTPAFPGCFPFQIDGIDCFDDFISCLKLYSLPEFEYIRLTFTDNEDLAVLCDERGYELHHKLYRMKAEVSPKR